MLLSVAVDTGVWRGCHLHIHHLQVTLLHCLLFNKGTRILETNPKDLYLGTGNKSEVV